MSGPGASAWLGVEAFVRAGLPPPPARVLEIGAGDGSLAATLEGAGYEVLAIDPSPRAPSVRGVALGELERPADPFDAAVAVLSLHHVHPLADSCRHLAELVCPGGSLVVDELDVGCFDERAARWWLAHGGDREHEGHEHEGPTDARELVAGLRAHHHPVAELRDALEPGFELAATARGPYLHRWELPTGLLGAEQGAIAAGEIPAVGARLVGRRR